MREILFKAKDLNGKWVEGSLKDVGGIQSIITFDAEACKRDEAGGWEIYDYTEDVTIQLGTVCQYTGLTDKNGNKIWEGDVNQDLGYVFWSKDFAAFQWRYSSGDVMDFEDEKEWCIIIGNIFDNPELLTND
jgi:hypothetical protein